MEAMAEDVVSVYTEPPRSEVGDGADAVNCSDGSPSKKRHRQCLSECDINSGTTANISNDEITHGIATYEASVATEDSNTAACTPTSPQKHINKENCAVVPSDNDTASPAAAAAAAAAAAGGGGEAVKVPSPTFKSPPQRRNVFAQSKDSSVIRQRFNVNATKDKLTSPEPIVEVRSR